LTRILSKKGSCMQTRTPLQTEPGHKQSSSLSLQQSIPWWNGLDPAVVAELKLPPVREVPLQFIDVAIIGGGVAGLSAALGVKKRAASANVLVLEKEEMLGYGATGRNAGTLTPGINMGMAELPPGGEAASFYPETTSIFHTLIEEAALPGAILSASRTGAICLAESARAARKLEREARTRLAAGLRAELWTPSQVTEATQGRLNVQSVVQALWLPDEGRIHPLTLLAHLAKQARVRWLVQIAGQADVIHYQEVEGMARRHHWQLTLADGTTFLARGLINCVGPTVEANTRIYALAFTAEFPDGFPLFWDASPYTYADYRPGNGRLGVSGGRYGRAGVTRNDALYYRPLADATRRWLPELYGKEPDFTWAVDLAVTPEMLPELRVLSDTAPGVAIEGLGAHGVLPGMVLGQRAGGYIVNQLVS
jgi:glycine/D-amino acid oxidase-like deaminating enzyme